MLLNIKEMLQIFLRGKKIEVYRMEEDATRTTITYSNEYSEGVYNKKDVVSVLFVWPSNKQRQPTAFDIRVQNEYGGMGNVVLCAHDLINIVD